METLPTIHDQLMENGFIIINDVFSENEIDTLVHHLASIDTSKPTFRKTNELFAIRQFLNELPETAALIFTERLTEIIVILFGKNYFVTKSIYFDKPALSNWFVAYHQDLTISVKEKIVTEGFGPWTIKQNQFAVQPPLSILENNFTIRIHLDDTDENNGALKVIPGSHLKNVYRPETINWNNEQEVSCNVKKGGIMIMRPLLLHASGRTTNEKQRRVIHIEFGNQLLPNGLQWSEYYDYSNLS